MGKWIKRKLPDYILCLCAALGLIMPLIRGFCVPDRLIGQPGWVLLASALFLLALFLFSYRRLTVLIGVCVGVVAAVMAVLSVRRSGLSLVDPSRQEENVLLWVIVVFLCVLLVFLLSRTKGSAAILLVLGVLCCTLSAFLQYSNTLGYLLLFLIGSGGGLLYAGYRRAVLEYHTAKVTMWRATAIATLFCVICLSISSAAWFLVVRPIDPPTQDLKLIQYLLSLEELERIGISSKLPIEGNQTAQQTEQSDKLEHTTPTPTPQPPTPTPQQQAPELNMRPQEEVGGEEIHYPAPPRWPCPLDPHLDRCGHCAAYRRKTSSAPRLAPQTAYPPPTGTGMHLIPLVPDAACQAGHCRKTRRYTG
ncbi:MAG: DUF4199 domain-containing protein [Oscillospiraceae bacterium]|nr:DUF4199 domain-containing protein [Oscillospiraceae bacterium]